MIASSTTSMQASWDQAVMMANDDARIGRLVLRYAALGALRDLARYSAPEGLLPSIEADGRQAMRFAIELASARLSGEERFVDIDSAPFEPRAAFDGQVLMARQQALGSFEASGALEGASDHLKTCFQADKEATRVALLAAFEDPATAALAGGDIDEFMRLAAAPGEQESSVREARPTAGEPAWGPSTAAAWAPSGYHGVESNGGPDWRGFWIGASVALVAVLISMGSYEAASTGGGTYVLFWGAALWGGWKALRSLVRS